ncbi:uncharacterized protein LOC129596605 isoform X2 [Paramacrobiotus metropolitanus]|uniref:uncharacterized protein LOC129596605 isoform X2 n=1 Tax=Paramacrobiotus metropolitanus TaxID=2943436 RepID=UPI0024460885|nr:uncharacterized protein LOC129596605 isoform X2 [Paramacrobiotus metropolitanus]
MYLSVFIALTAVGLCSSFPSFVWGGNVNPIEAGIASGIKKPTVTVNRDTGVSSSQSISNNVLATMGNNPSLKNSQGLSSAITIKGPLGTNTDTFDNVANFGTNAGDIGQSFAQGGQSGPKSVGTQTGVNIALKNDRPGQPAMASSFNKANQFAASTGTGGRHGTNFWGQAGAFGQVN